MKKYYLPMLLSLAALPVAAQWQWPVKGVKTGEGIVYRPQDRIDKELNFGDLFIAAPEGTTSLPSWYVAGEPRPSVARLALAITI